MGRRIRTRAPAVLSLVALTGCALFSIDGAPVPGSTVTQGLEVVGADAWHAAGYRGAGVRVAVWDYSFHGYQELLGRELPEADRVVARGFGVPVTGFRDEHPDDASHGTAVAEIVYDFAPEATLYLMAADTEDDVIDGLTWLLTQDVDVIVASITVDAWCLDLGTSFFESTFRELRDRGVLLVAAAGNDGVSHWKGRFHDADGDGDHDFSTTDDTISFEAFEGEFLDVLLRWEDPCRPSSNDYDLTLLDDRGRVVGESTYDNALDGPVEELFDEIPHDGTFHIRITRHAGAQAVDLDLVWANGPEFEHGIAAGSISTFEPAVSPSALTVGSVTWRSLSLEETSSRGPTADGRIKPDLVAPTCVETSTYSGDPTSEDSALCGFSGTSAAAPHVAGAAALIVQAHPDWSPDQLQAALEANAVDLGAPGKDSTYGAGLLRLPPPPQAVP